MKKWSVLASAISGEGQIQLTQLGLHEHPAFRLAPGNTVFTIGSCFARNIEDRLEGHGLIFPIKHYPAQPNEFSGPRPRGILNKFTPSCMLEDIRWLTAIMSDEQDFKQETRERFYFSVGEDQVVDLGLQEFIAVTEARFWQRRRDILEVYRSLYHCDAVILTLGLIEQWYYRGQVVQHAPSNRAMLKQRADFSFATMTDDDVKQALNEIVTTLQAINPDIKVIFTVSPVPLKSTFEDRHVFVANTLSKSRLVTAVHTLREQAGDVDYFPSYEIVQLVGRTAFEADMRHVKDAVVKAICHYFSYVYLR